MVAPTYSWNTITAAQVDVNSPVTEDLMASIQENLIHLEEWLGDGYTAAKDHDHDDVNSKVVSNVANVAIKDGHITKTYDGDGVINIGAASSWTPASDQIITLSGGHADLHLQVYQSAAWNGVAQASGTVIFDTAKVRVYNANGGAQNLYVLELE